VHVLVLTSEWSYYVHGTKTITQMLLFWLQTAGDCVAGVHSGRHYTIYDKAYAIFLKEIKSLYNFRVTVAFLARRKISSSTGVCAIGNATNRVVNTIQLLHILRAKQIS